MAKYFFKLDFMKYCYYITYKCLNTKSFKSAVSDGPEYVTELGSNLFFKWAGRNNTTASLKIYSFKLIRLIYFKMTT